MTREIKFRGWDKETKKVYIVNSLTLDFRLCDLWDGTPEHEGLCRKWDEVEFLQYTGLKDKNGKEIFEGDRVKHDQFPTPLIVQWDWDQWGLFDGICNEASIGRDDVEVIGNVYEG